MITSWNGKPYHSLDYMLKERFGEKVYKVTLNGGMSCPNRDGTIGHGGKTAGLVGSHLPINSDIGAVQFQTAQQGARGNGVAQDENPVQIQDSTVCQGNSCHGFLSANGFQLSGIYRNVFPDDLTIGIRREQVHLGGNFRQVNDLMFKFP